MSGAKAGGLFSAVVTLCLVFAIACTGAWASTQIVRAVGGSIGWAAIEGAIVLIVLVLIQLVGLRHFGRWLRNKARLERLAARNERIRTGAGFEPADVL